MLAIGEVAALRRVLSGRALVPGEPGFAEALRIDNGRVDLVPAVLVQVDGIADVVHTLAFARRLGLRPTVKGGGHSATGYCLNAGGLVLDMGLMNAIALDADARTVTVQMGARWHDVYVRLIESGTGLIPIGGGCPTVGIPGFMQGGGYSFVSRSYGMSIDNLLAMTLVTPDGAVHHLHDGAQAPLDRELWWACRGGGGGNWGVVVDMTLRVHAPPTGTMLTGGLRFLPERAQEVMAVYNDWVETLPDAMAAYGIWGMSPDPADPSRSIQTFGFTIIHNGDAAEGMRLLRPLLELGPLSTSLSQTTLPEFELLNGASTLVADRSAYIRAGVLPRGGFSPEVVAIFQRYMASAPSPDSFIVWTLGGGAISRVAQDATAFVHREGRFIPELKAIWTDPADARANIEWAHAFFAALEPHFSGAYVNYIDPLLAGWAKKYYGANYRRLVEAKHACDPDGVFGFQQGVGSDFEPDLSQPLDLSPLNRTFQR